MSRDINFSNLGGLYVYQNTLAFMQASYLDTLAGLALFFGDKVILTGVEQSGGNITGGYVTWNGQIHQVIGGSAQAYLFPETVVSQEQFDDGQMKDVYRIITMRLTSLAGGSSIPLADFKKLPFNSNDLKDAFTKIQTLIKGVAGLEPAVIISGCVVSNVAGGLCDISTGVSLFDGAYVSSPARVAGAFPVYLKADGTYTTTQPGSGTYITFNHETSQRYKDVLKRSMYGSGEVLMSTSATDLAQFDLATGLGKWKWKGWKICDLIQSRVPIGYDRRSADPADGIWDNNYRTLGYSDGTKSNARPIFTSNLPHEKLDIPVGFNDAGGGTQANILQKPGETSGGPTAGTIQTEYMGDGIAFDIRQAYRVVLYIEKI